MTLVLVADIHANLPAFEAVLDDIAQSPVDGILNAGDSVGYGPFPEEVIQLLKRHKVLNVRGNLDQKILDVPFKIEKWKRKHPLEKWLGYQWTWEKLSVSSRLYLKEQPLAYRLEYQGITIQMVHASPTSMKAYITKETPMERKVDIMRLTEADLLVFGHTHEAMVEQIGPMYMVNPGSVGRPPAHASHACYMVLELVEGKVHIEERKVQYPLENTLKALQLAALPDIYQEMFITGKSLNDLLMDKQIQDEETMEATVNLDKDYHHNLAHSSETLLAHEEADEARQASGCLSRNRPDVDLGDHDQSLHAVKKLAESYQYEKAHAEQVTMLALELFDGLSHYHSLQSHDRRLLEYASMLHDIGWNENGKGHHKKSLKLILHKDSVPFSFYNRLLIANIARYHRRAEPSNAHKYFAKLDEADKLKVKWLAGMLRLADGLDCTHRSNVLQVFFHEKDKALHIELQSQYSAEAEIAIAREKCKLLEKMLQKPLHFEEMPYISKRKKVFKK